MIRLKCNNCGTEYKYEDSELEVECTGSDERQMGPEKMYSGTLDFNCEKCDNHIIAEFNFWEYPVLVLNYSEYSEEGCVVLEEPNYHELLVAGEKQGNEDYEE